jgi:hypothetical protein
MPALQRSNSSCTDIGFTLRQSFGKAEFRYESLFWLWFVRH